jgi:hypothetical protein
MLRFVMFLIIEMFKRICQNEAILTNDLLILFIAKFVSNVHLKM